MGACMGDGLACYRAREYLEGSWLHSRPRYRADFSA